MTLSKYGIREWGGGSVLLFFFIIIVNALTYQTAPITGIFLTTIAICCWLIIVAFFRNPKRKIPQAPNLILSPADGVVKDIEIIENCNINGFQGITTVRIGIFLSVLDVHLNRAPCDIEVNHKEYRKGYYHDARSSKCSKENEAMTISGNGNAAGIVFPVAIRQISGAIARRIVCQVSPDDQLKHGQLYGMIKFGSRTELYLPVRDDIIIEVEPGKRVYAGTTILASINAK